MRASPLPEPHVPDHLPGGTVQSGLLHGPCGKSSQEHPLTDTVVSSFQHTQTLNTIWH